MPLGPRCAAPLMYPSGFAATFRKRMEPVPKITKWLMIAMVAVQLLDDILRVSGAGNLSTWFALRPLAFGFLPWQVLTYAFLHGDLIHMLFNVFALWMFGAELEQHWGQKRYLQFLAASVLAGALTQLVVTALMHSTAPMVGASAGIYGLLMAQAMYWPERPVHLMFPPVTLKTKTFVLIFAVLALWMGLRGPSLIAHFAHLGGLLGGYLMVLYWRRRKPPAGGRWLH